MTQRVLVIDDNVETADGLRAVLELEGYDVQVAFDGEQGLERARAFAPDVVLCDIGMPRLDGYQLATRLRAEPGLDHTKIVAITGYELPAPAAGFDVHFTKPIIVDELIAALARFARDRMGRRD